MDRGYGYKYIYKISMPCIKHQENLSGVGVRMLDYDFRNPSSNAHCVMEVFWVTLGQ